MQRFVQSLMNLWGMGVQVLELLDKVKQDQERKERGNTTLIEPSSTPLKDDVDNVDYQNLEDEEEEEVEKPRPKKKLNSKLQWEMHLED